MTIGIMPITGITLPLVSYGGSSLLTTIVSIALVLNISMRKKKLKFNKNKSIKINNDFNTFILYLLYFTL